MGEDGANDEVKLNHSEHIEVATEEIEQNDVRRRKQRNVDLKHVDEAARVLGEAKVDEGSIIVSPEDDRRILHRIDVAVLPAILLVYFLQQLDKSSISYTAVFNIVGETHLVGTQYSWLSSIVYVAQLVFQPLSSYAIVRLPVGKWVFFNILCWGIVVASSSAATNFAGLIAARFLLGIFEASIAPSFIAITQMWWRRREQTYRTAAWNSSNGVCGVFGSLVAFGVGHINNTHLKPYQSIFLFCGCITIATSPFVWFFLPDSPATANFLKGQDRVFAIERLRANNMGTETKVWKWNQFWETFRDPKSYLWFAMLFLAALPSGGIGAFGTLIIQGFGFDSFQSILFNMPYGALSIVAILGGAWLTNKIKLRFPVIVFLCCFPVAGCVALLKLGRGAEERGSLLAAYYILSVFGGIQPMLYAWAPLNACGHTKKVTTTAIFFVAQCVGNIVGPQVYQPSMAPRYTPGLIVDLICWSLLAVVACITAAYLALLNRRQEAKRKRLGKAALVVDTSILTIEDAAKAREYREDAKNSKEQKVTNDQAFLDLTDFENEDFVYVL
ncbi:putative allantoate transporter [Schizopora paradoxa]|uniref:Putative allantoate transporter n=1 Tax=Schizopora paradoxa TaxID=27342 RepID=A0A0H2SF54_9AGAM|nr:putative allantoate transporter [Schizopora paradoxa]